MIELGEFRVLLVEDNELDRRVMLRNLAGYPDSRFDVAAVGTLADALQAVDGGGFDCILLDLSLPDSTGLASVDALMDRSDECPVIVLSGLDDPQVAVEAVERGAQDYLTKRTADPELVARAIRYAITRSRGESELRTTRNMLNVMHERERIARDLHDTVIQQLFATGMSLQAMTARVDDEMVRSRLVTAAGDLDDAIRQLREAIFGLHSTQPTASLAEELTQICKSKEEALGFRPTVRVVPGVDGLDDNVRRELLATLSEALSNVAKHAAATAVQIIVELTAGEVVLRVIDNGHGFDVEPEGSPSPKSKGLTGRGLGNMHRRAVELSGGMTIAVGPGGGTELVWRARER